MWSAGRERSAATAWLRVEYKAPVLVPGPAVCEVLVERVEGRKIFCKARFMATDSRGGASKDGDGVLAEAPAPLVAVAEGTALFVELRPASAIEARARETGHAKAI
mmetsp:Transcript_73353/g.228067  ORF Transcript_73353/g.228067 Transcript_73353/m.228067 type:complete len:106 (-) Transcript_73353:93-410(-)